MAIASPKFRDVLARKAAKLNAGRMPTELIHSVEIFRSYLHGLNAIDGLIGVCHPHGYMMEFDAGLLFDAEEIGRRIAQLVHEHFCRSMEFSFEIDPSFQSGGAQRAQGGSVAIKSTDVLLDEPLF
jgi:hypothetical protein